MHQRECPAQALARIDDYLSLITESRQQTQRIVQLGSMIGLMADVLHRLALNWIETLRTESANLLGNVVQGASQFGGKSADRFADQFIACWRQGSAGWVRQLMNEVNRGFGAFSRCLVRLVLRVRLISI